VENKHLERIIGRAIVKRLKGALEERREEGEGNMLSVY
jgi:hypothetical protein